MGLECDEAVWYGTGPTTEKDAVSGYERSTYNLFGTKPRDRYLNDGGQL